MADDQALEEFLKTVDTSKFANQPFVKRVEKPWGYEIHWVPEGLPYMGKLIHIDSAKRLSLQVHDRKRESWFLIKGKGKVVWEDKDGNAVETELEAGKGYNLALGQRHRLVGITDCDIIEVSTPETGNTYRLEDDYARPTETEEMRKDPNRGWST